MIRGCDEIQLNNAIRAPFIRRESAAAPDAPARGRSVGLDAKSRARAYPNRSDTDKSTVCVETGKQNETDYKAVKCAGFNLAPYKSEHWGPAQEPHITHAANRFKGGMEIATVDEFLGYAVKMEKDAAIHFDELATTMEGCGNQEVAKLFRQLAGFYRARRRNGRVRILQERARNDVRP